MENKKPARRTKSSVQKKTTSETVKESVVEEETTVEAEPVKEKRVYAKDDLISCRNLFPGTNIMIGKRSKNKYIWTGFGDEQEVEYEDLKAAVLNKRSDFIYSPTLLIQDDEFISQFPYLENFYKNMATPEELVSLVETGSAEELEDALASLPQGLKDSIKGIVATLIYDGKLDSVKKIKVLDEVLGTELLKQVEMFS